MSQDNKKSFVMYQGDGSNKFFPVPMTKGKYGTISVAFVRRGLDQYEYNPDTWGLNGGLFAWDLSGTKVYTDTATPAIGATIYDQYGVDTGDTVTAVGGATITVNTNVYTRDTLHDVDENTVLTWTGDTLQIGDYIVIERTTTRTQPFEFQNNQKHIEKSDDNLERQIQEVADKVDNALLVDPTHTIDSNKMNPVEWMKTILRSVDKSVRGFRYLNGWLDYSLDDPNIAEVDKTWTHLVNTDNVKAIRERSRIEDGETIYYTEYLAQDGLWKTLSDPHKWDNMTLADLADTDFSGLSAGNFIMYDGLHWKNVYSAATASWGTLLGNITAQTDLMAEFAKYVRTDGGSTMTNPLMMRATADFKCAIAPYWDGIGFFKLNDNDSVTLMASLEYQDSFMPAETNTYNVGALTKKWKNLYLSGKAFVATINNGYDLAVPAKSGTLATMGDVELAARSGRMLTDQGVWYAKMYAATVVPTGAGYDGTNYADFSQVDADNNPVIKIYTGASGAWALTETITPPADYDGYVPITKKIWDIVEQSGQQGGRVLWNHTSKEFTPSPLIVSFDGQNITNSTITTSTFGGEATLSGNSTVAMPLNPTDDNIPNKKYVDDKFLSQTYRPDLFDWKWADHELDDTQWLSADTFSWQDGTVYENAYQHLVDDYNSALAAAPRYIEWGTSPAEYLRYPYYDRSSGGVDYYCWQKQSDRYYTTSDHPSVGDTVYDTDLQPISYLVSYVDNGTNTETIEGVTITYYKAADGHKIALVNQQNAAEQIYTRTSVAWYYILDTTNQRFKLPRAKHNKYADTLGVAGNGITLGITNGTQDGGLGQDSNNDLSAYTGLLGANVGSARSGTAISQANVSWGITTDGSKSGIIAQQTQDTDQYKHLYFYVGEFTQTAIENTAGLNAELFNGKADIDAQNFDSTGRAYLAGLAMPSNTYDNLTLGASGATYTAPGNGWFTFNKLTSATGQYGNLVNETNGMNVTNQQSASGSNVRVYLPAKKGDVIKCSYSAGGTLQWFRFVYAQGEI